MHLCIAVLIVQGATPIAVNGVWAVAQAGRRIAFARRIATLFGNSEAKAHVDLPVSLPKVTGTYRSLWEPRGLVCQP